MAERRPKRRSPIYSRIVLATVNALKKLGGEGHIHKISDFVTAQEEIDGKEQSRPMLSEKQLKNYLGYSRTYLKMSGDLENVSWGVWKLTEAGYKINTLDDATRALRRYDKVRAEKSLEKLSTTDEISDEINSDDSERNSELSKKRNFVISPDAVPSIPGIMLATIIAIKELGGSGHIYEIIACVIKNEEISEEEQSYTMPSDHRTKLNYYLAWTRTYLKISGNLESVTYGTWALTDAGHQINNLQDAEAAYGKYIARLAQRNSKKEEEEEKANNDAELTVIGEKIAPDDKAWRVTLLGYLRVMEPDAFEYLSKLILCKAGFKNVEVTGGVADGGVDGVGFLHENLLSRKIYFQCKRWTKNIGSPQIRNFRGALDGRVNQGLFIATSRFTAPAIKEATRDGAILIDLIDEKKLCDLLKEHKLGVETSPDGQTITPDPNYFTNLTPNPQQQGN